MIDTETFKKNLERWETLYPKDAKKLKTLQCKEVAFHQNPDGQRNLTSQHEGQAVYFHATAGAKEEAQAQFDALDLKNISVIIVYGVGLGYFYDAAKEWLHQNKTHGLAFVEDNLEVLHRLFETERGTEILHDQQVWIAYLDPKMSILDSLAQVFVIRPYQMIALPFYEKNKKTFITSIQSRLAFYMNLRAGIAMEYEGYGRLFFYNFFRNIFALPEAHYGNKLFDQFKGVPAIICGAGPSLGKNIEVLQTLRDRALIFAGGTAMNALNATGFLPHFGIGIDPNLAQFTRLIMNQAYEIPFLFRNRLRNEALEIVHGDHLYITGTMGYEISNWFEEKFGITGIKVEEGFNVVNFSVALAHAMGCNPILLVGLDLAYTDGLSYAPGIINHPLHDRREYFRTKSSEEELLSKEDIYGNPTLTLWKWISESTWYTSFEHKYPNLVMVNATEGGIGFMDIPNITLAEAAEKLLRTQYDFQGMVSAAIQKCPLPSSVTKENIQSATKEILDSLRRCYEYCEIVRDDFSSVENKLNEDLEIPDNFLTDKALEALTNLEQEPGYQYALKAFNDHFFQLFTREFQRLSFDESLLTERDLTLKRIRLNYTRYNYLKETAKILRQTIEKVLDENAEKSKIAVTRQQQPVAAAPPKQDKGPGEHYTFENNVLTLKDPELGLSFEAAFIPDEIGGKKLSHYPSGGIKAEQYYLDDSLHGPSSFFDENGQLLARFWFIHGVRQGKGHTYYANGSLRSIEKYKDGAWEGEQIYYYPDGKLKSLLPYKQGQLDGEVRLYHPNGLQERQLHFVQGKRQGFERVWNTMGLMVIEAEFDQDKPKGIARKWFDNGNLELEAIYEPDSHEFKFRQWNEMGVPVEPDSGKFDYIDRVTHETSKLTTSLGQVFQQVASIAPLIERVAPPDTKAALHEDLQKGMQEIKGELIKLEEINKKLLFEAGIDIANPQEAIWKSPSNRREVEKQVELMTQEMSVGMQGIQSALVKTLGLLSKKIDQLNEERRKAEKKEPPQQSTSPEESPHESK